MSGDFSAVCVDILAAREERALKSFWLGWLACSVLIWLLLAGSASPAPLFQQVDVFVSGRDGRLAIPMWRFEPWSVFVLISEDHGRPWHRGGFVPDVVGDECQLVELADGGWLILTFTRFGREWLEPPAGSSVP